MRRSVRASCCAALVLHVARTGMAACPDNNGTAYRADTDGDGHVDGCDACPSVASPEHGSVSPSRDPSCYLGTGWIPDEYRYGEPAAVGAWWVAHGCEPALVYPVVEEVEGKERRGIVVIGGPPSPDGGPEGASRVREIARAGGEWPSDVPARCVVSIDYGSSLPKVSVFALEAPSLATLYSGWCAGADTCGDDPRYSPKVGLGLVVSGPVERIAVRASSVDLEDASFERLAFSRGVVLGPALTSSQGPLACTEVGDVPVPEDLHWDPMAGPALTDTHRACKGITRSDVIRDVALRVVPHALDRALREQTNRVVRALQGSSAATQATGAALEGVPIGFRADDRAPPDAFQDAYFLPTGASLHRTTVDSTLGWVVVPAAIGALQQNLRFAASTPSAQKEAWALTPHPPGGSAEYSAAGDVLLALQRFTLDPEIVLGISADAERTVEVLWPGWPPIAATSERNRLYGTRWTTNLGSRSCWAGNDYEEVPGSNQHQSYPVSAAMPEAQAAAWCPETLARWRQATPASRSHAAVNVACAPGDIYSRSLANPEPLAHAYACCQLGDDGDITRATACCQASGCDPTHLSSCSSNECCQDVLDRLAGEPRAGLECVANEVLKLIAGFTPDIHWPSISNELIPMVALIRTEGLEPSLLSYMTNQDLFLGGAHQGLDWNWKVDDQQPHAIDPAFRIIGRRYSETGNAWEFRGIENELEFLIAMGAWNVQKAPPRDCTGKEASGRSCSGRTGPVGELHGRCSYESFLGKDIEALGQIWPTTAPFKELFGIQRDPGLQNGPSYPVGLSAPARPGGVLEPFWRAHYGRGLFMPLNSATLFAPSAAAYMATNPSWPMEDDDHGEIVPMGVEHWGVEPHRIGFLGRAVLDCGHDGGKIELHPPHVVSMELARLTRDGAFGVVTATFGWVNVTVKGSLEFDLWPPPRPSAKAELVAIGHASRAENGTDCTRADLPVSATDPFELGHAVDCTAPQSRGARPTLSCTPQPTPSPNHLHCVFEDPSGRAASDPVWEPKDTPARLKADGQIDLANPRMTPYFATSRFELRAFLGWKEPK